MDLEDSLFDITLGAILFILAIPIFFRIWMFILHYRALRSLGSLQVSQRETAIALGQIAVVLQQRLGNQRESPEAMAQEWKVSELEAYKARAEVAMVNASNEIESLESQVEHLQRELGAAQEMASERKHEAERAWTPPPAKEKPQRFAAPILTRRVSNLTAVLVAVAAVGVALFLVFGFR